MINLREELEKNIVKNYTFSGVSPVSEKSIKYAELFLKELPPNILDPEVGLDFEGCVSLDWHKSHKKEISISISDDGAFYYAFLNEEDSGNGRFRDYDSVFDLIRTVLREKPDDDKKRGPYGKYIIKRINPSEKHENCDYFVLDISHDPFAIDAIKAYANACKSEYPLLAKDLARKIEKKNEC